MPITAFYAALLTPILIFLTMRTVAGRQAHRVSFGDGGHKDLMQRIRRHGNFVEYTPFGLILLGLAESVGTMAPVLHAGALALLAGRVIHAQALTPAGGNLTLRKIGMVLTILSLAGPAIACLIGSLRQLL
jgi:uncharacterized membrane protein YecN with MAPEG domain